MSEQIDAFARGSDPQTSHDAAAAVRYSQQERNVYNTLKGHSQGLTSVGIAQSMGIERDRVSARLKPLESKGLVLRSGTRVEQNDDGSMSRPRTVWVAK